MVQVTAFDVRYDYPHRSTGRGDEEMRIIAVSRDGTCYLCASDQR